MTPPDILSVTQGLTRCDEGAWRTFHDFYYARLSQLAIARGAPPCDAPDIVQGVYLRVLRHAKTFRRAEDFDAWLACLTRCEVIDAARRTGRRHWLAEKFQHWQATQQDTLKHSSPPCCEAALLTLTESDRTLVRQHYLDGRSQQELADDLQLTVKAVESKLARLRKRLRHVLSKPNPSRT